jgi:hypothetical protein
MRKRILFLDNLLRPESHRSQSFFYGVLRESLQIAGFEVGLQNKSGTDIDRGVDESFDAKAFLDKCGVSHWTQAYHGISREAQDYIIDYLPADALAIGYEMPPWLTSILERTNTPYVTFQISPLRFARDLFIAIRSNIPGFDAFVRPISLNEDDLYLEAALLRAKIQRRQHASGSDARKGQLVFIGQTAGDASLLRADGTLATVSSFAEEIRKIAGPERMAYKPHPYAGRFSRAEKSTLEEIVGCRVPCVKENAYNLLAEQAPNSFLTISSGVSQEAKYFRRTARVLYRPLCEIHPATGASAAAAHHQIHFSDFVSPRFWSQMLVGDGSAAVVGFAASYPPNHFRHALGKWWGYDAFMIDNDPFWHRVFTRGLLNSVKRLFR